MDLTIVEDIMAHKTLDMAPLLGFTFADMKYRLISPTYLARVRECRASDEVEKKNLVHLLPNRATRYIARTAGD